MNQHYSKLRLELYSLCLIIPGIFVYKPVLYSLPNFSNLVELDLWINLLVSFSSDVFLFGIILFSFFTLDALGQRFRKTFIKPLLKTIVALFVVTANAAHIRYIQHFGETVKPFLFQGFGKMNADGVIINMILESFFVWSYACITFVISVLLYLVSAKRFLVPRSNTSKLVGALLVIIVSNVAFIQLRHQPKVHLDLARNSFSALAFNLKQYHQSRDYSVPSKEQLEGIASFFGKGPSEKENMIDGIYYPLLQTSSMRTIEEQPSSQSKAYQELLAFLKNEERTHGPWNINVVMLESALSHYIQLQNPSAPEGISPSLDRYLGDSILFNYAFASGKSTKDGQASFLCSIMPLPKYHMMIETPRLESRCLSDVLVESGYESYFFYGSENNFDNQHIFYRQHQIKHMIADHNFPENTPKGGWGYSDHAMFSKVLEVLPGSKLPFFSLSLSLTHHAPHIVPADAPDYIAKKEEWTDSQKTFHYMDWAFGEFMDEFSIKFPHSITIIVSDQGTNIKPSLEEDTDYKAFEANHRIPIGIYIPNMPKALKSQVFDHPVSIMDLAPTLLSFLTEESIQHQFIGSNLFDPQSAFYVQSQYSVRKILGIKDQYQYHQMSDDMRDVYAGMFMYHLFYPRLKNRKE